LQPTSIDRTLFPGNALDKGFLRLLTGGFWKDTVQYCMRRLGRVVSGWGEVGPGGNAGFWLVAVMWCPAIRSKRSKTFLAGGRGKDQGSCEAPNRSEMGDGRGREELLCIHHPCCPSTIGGGGRFKPGITTVQYSIA
jgi:hypothetical protein